MLQRPIELAQYTSWAFGQRLRSAGLLGSMGSIGDCYDNSLVESFFGSMQLELLDRQPWATHQGLANAIFEWIEAWYNPRRRHSSLGNLSQSTTNDTTPRPQPRPDHHRQAVRETGASSVATLFPVQEALICR
ncbi:hypothetical protein DLJ47_33355 [Micromonospora sp. S4605]|uniref:integrase core domain-containing protein n=1 Tax=Micromonospora sp. S4605 TaxID=1420897 RepID=UPI000D6EF4A8|nr:hypothetical protein DLJ47_33355 [Micromonospora sp. S4605]